MLHSRRAPVLALVSRCVGKESTMNLGQDVVPPRHIAYNRPSLAASSLVRVPSPTTPFPHLLIMSCGCIRDSVFIHGPCNVYVYTDRTESGQKARVCQRVRVLLRLLCI